MCVVSIASLVEYGALLSKSIDMSITLNVYDLSTIKNHVQSINQLATPSDDISEHLKKHIDR